MSKKANPVMIGGFVIGAMILMIVGLLAFGGGGILTERIEYVVYFDGALGGLDIGAPVEFEGVKVGKVSDIKLVMNRKDYSIYIPVLISLEPDRVDRTGKLRKGAPDTPKDVLRLMIFRGMRAQLQAESFVTGKMKVVLVMRPDTPVRYRDYAGRPEIPTVPSTKDILADRFLKLRLDELVVEIMDTARAVGKLVSSPDLARTLQSLNTALGDLSGLAVTLDERVEPLSDQFTDTLKDVSRLSKQMDRRLADVSADLKKALEAATNSLDRVTGAMATVESVIEEDSPLRYELSKALKELSAASRSIRIMSEYLERHPEALLRGKGSTKER